MGIITRESRVWNAKGVQPAPGDEVYSAGDQPIAAYDNWAMWAITADIQDINDTMGDHSGRHEADGADELNLHQLAINNVGHFEGDTDTGRVSLVNTSDGTVTATIDVADDVVTTWPDFTTPVAFRRGGSIGDDLARSDTGGLIYDYDAGKVEYAKDADFATDAGFAAEAGDADTLDGLDSTAFIRPGDASVNPTGEWTYSQTVNADISGHAATAGHAETAETADFATESGNSDTVDGYHAQDLIDAAQQSGEWQLVGRTEHASVGDPFVWQVQADTEYDVYRIDIYHESHSESSGIRNFELQIGRDGTVDSRHDYEYQQQVNWGDSWDNRTEDHFPVGNAYAHRETYSSWIVARPTSVNTPTDPWPTISQDVMAFGDDMPEFLHHGNLQRDYSAIDTFRLESDTTTSTGRINIFGRNMR